MSAKDVEVEPGAVRIPTQLWDEFFISPEDCRLILKIIWNLPSGFDGADEYCLRLTC